MEATSERARGEGRAPVTLTIREIEAGITEAYVEPEPKAKRRKGTSPTQRTLKELRKREMIAQVVERWNPHAKVRVDLFGVIDLVVIAPPKIGAARGAILGIQACAGSSHAARRDKILAEPRAGQWVDAGGRLELWSWSQRGAAGKAKRWTLRVETYAEMVAAASAHTPA